MSLKDFAGLLKFADRRQKIRNNKPVALKESQKEMIRITKEKEKKNNA